jgi:hypothetical protein
MTNGQLASLSVCRAPIWSPWPDFKFSVWRLRVSWCGAPSLTRGWVCNLLVQSLLDLARAVTLGSMSRRTQPYFTVSFESPRIYCPQEQGGPVTSLGTGFPFVASYDSQGYGGGILTCLHTRYGKKIQVKIKVTLRPTVHISFFLLGVGPPHPYPPWTGWSSPKSKLR